MGLDDLLKEKEEIDEKSSEIDDRLKDLSDSKTVQSRRDPKISDKYTTTKQEFFKISKDRDNILENKKIVEKKIEDMSNDFEIIAYERNSIRSEDEKIEERCKDMQSELGSMSQMLSNRELTDSFFQRLENIRTTKQDILSNDKEIEEENNMLWVTARDIKGKMEANSKKHSLIDEDNHEIQKLFKDI